MLASSSHPTERSLKEGLYRQVQFSAPWRKWSKAEESSSLPTCCLDLPFHDTVKRAMQCPQWHQRQRPSHTAHLWAFLPRSEGSLLQDQASSGAATYLTLKYRHPACPSPQQQQQKHHTKLKAAPHPKPPERWHSEALFSLPSSWLQHILLYHFSSFWYSKPNNLPAGLVNYRELAGPKVLCYRAIIQAANC